VWQERYKSCHTFFHTADTGASSDAVRKHRTPLLSITTGKEQYVGEIDTITQFTIDSEPNYIEQGNEKELFTAAFKSAVPLIVKGPTGCGKTRFIEYMAYTLQLPLITVSCHEDLTAADLLGRYLFKNNQTEWHDGPMTCAVRSGGICYLDEIVEARKDTTVLIHSLTDDRRILYLDTTGEVIRAHKNFMMVLSYNPGYQNIVKDLKPSTKQRFASIVFDHPPLETETAIVQTETGIDKQMSKTLAEMAVKIRELKGFGLEEGVSSRLLVYAGRLIKRGLSPYDACMCAINHTLTDDREIEESIRTIVNLYFGNL
jgi:nitric oxide reductase NorQ protein